MEIKEFIKASLVDMHKTCRTDRYGQVSRSNFMPKSLFGDRTDEVLDYLKSDGTSGKVWLQVSAYVKSDSAVCRRVQIGVKEEPIYGLECD